MLLKCPECDDSVSDQVTRCPHCGCLVMDEQTVWQTMRRVLPDFSLADAKEMIVQDAARQRVKAEHGKLFHEIVALLFRHDPESISYGRADAYEPEVGTILPRLQSCHSSGDVLCVVREEFVRWFDNSVGPEENYEKIAVEIWELWQKHRTARSSTKQSKVFGKAGRRK
jgi:hypothetical protein